MRFVTSKLVVTMSALNHLQLSSFSAHFFSFRPLVSPSSALASFPLHPSVLPLSPLYPPCPPSSRSFSSRGGKCCSYTFNFHCAGIPEICNISTLCAYEPENEGRTLHTFSICVLKHDYTHSCLIYCPSIIKTWSSSCSWCVSYVKHLGICRCCSQYVIVSCIKPQISGWRRKSGVLNLFGLKKNIVHQGRLSLGEPQLNLNGEPWPWII